jgi:serine/threonine-protein kinase
VRATAVSAALVLLCAAGAARADVNAQDHALARALFDQARDLMDKGKHAEACPKLEESQRLDPGIGTLFNLAHCYEQIGRTASAWSLFLDVAVQAKANNQPDREKAARQRAKSVEPRVPKLAVVVSEAAQVPGIEVRRDGTVVGKAMWGAPMPADPGPHAIEASAPGKKKWSAQVRVEPGAPPASVTVPALEDESAGAIAAPGVAGPAAAITGPSVAPRGAVGPQPSSPAADQGASAGSQQRLFGVVVGGAGLVGLGIGGVLALGAKSRYAEAEAYCRGSLCTQAGQDIHDEARSRGNVATIVGVVGLAALAGGAVLYFTAPTNATQTKAQAARSAWISAGPATVGFGGAW